ncbi:MAG: hypothetical protein CL393_04225, partial [Acidiferrobacteraceae bacterium]|nr:hypothetical protein [Acidiferrobacteraceae bacterium]
MTTTFPLHLVESGVLFQPDRGTPLDIRNVLSHARDYLGLSSGGEKSISDVEQLGTFINARASFVSQTSLYGYVKTRAGTRFPDLFENSVFLESINIAKWQIWVACISDLTLYCGGLLYQHTEDSKQVKSILVTIIDSLISSTGRPDEAGEAFTASLQTVHSRIESESLAEITEDDRIFTASPDALVHWAPIVDELKVLDEGIVRNSIRFRWQETRRELKRHLNRQAVIASVA